MRQRASRCTDFASAAARQQSLRNGGSRTDFALTWHQQLVCEGTNNSCTDFASQRRADAVVHGTYHDVQPKPTCAELVPAAEREEQPGGLLL